MCERVMHMWQHPCAGWGVRRGKCQNIGTSTFKSRRTGVEFWLCPVCYELWRKAQELRNKEVSQ